MSVDWGMVRRLAAMAPGQVVGWTSTFYVPMLFGQRMADELNLSLETIYGGVTVMMFAAAAMASLAGALLGRRGPRRVMSIGFALLALGCVLLANADHVAVFASAWVVFGVAVPMALSQAASTAVQQLFPRAARRPLGVMALVTTLTPTLMLPVLYLLEQRIGWRGCCIGLSIAHMAICLPLNAAAVPRDAPQQSPEPQRSIAAGHAHDSLAWVALAVAFGIGSFVAWGVGAQLIGLARGLGHAEGIAVVVAAFAGPAQLAGRLAEVLVAERVPVQAMGLLALALIAIGLVAGAADGSSVPGLGTFIILFGAAQDFLFAFFFAAFAAPPSPGAGGDHAAGLGFATVSDGSGSSRRFISTASWAFMATMRAACSGLSARLVRSSGSVARSKSWVRFTCG